MIDERGAAQNTLALLDFIIGNTNRSGNPLDDFRKFLKALSECDSLSILNKYKCVVEYFAKEDAANISSIVQAIIELLSNPNESWAPAICKHTEKDEEIINFFEKPNSPLCSQLLYALSEILSVDIVDLSRSNETYAHKEGYISIFESTEPIAFYYDQQIKRYCFYFNKYSTLSVFYSGETPKPGYTYCQESKDITDLINTNLAKLGEHNSKKSNHGCNCNKKCAII